MRKLMLAMVFPFAASCAHADDLKKLDRLCKDAGANAASAEDDKSAWKMWTAKGTQVHFSYSAVIDTCVGTRVDYLRNEWDIQDVTGGFMNFHSLFDCSKSGAFNALIDKVQTTTGALMTRVIVCGQTTVKAVRHPRFRRRLPSTVEKNPSHYSSTNWTNYICSTFHRLTNKLCENVARLHKQ